MNLPPAANAVRRLFPGIVLAVALGAGAALSAGCTEQPRWAGSLEVPPADAARVLKVTGTGRMSLPPSQVSFDCVVLVTAPTPEAAWKEGSARITKLTKALEQAAVATADLAMSEIGLAQAGAAGADHVAPYALVQHLTVTLRELQRLPAVLTVVLGAGADGVQNARFGITDKRMAGDRARERALIEARLKAEMLAQEVGLRLGAVRAVEELPVPEVAVEGSLQQPPGSFEVVSQLLVTYELLD